MLVFTQKPSLSTINTLIFSTLFISTMYLMTGCYSQSVSSSNDVTAQTNGTDKNTVKEDNVQAHKLAEQPNDKIVNTSGYQKLSFGQVIKPELIRELGLTRAESDNEQCYYVSHPAQSYVDKEYGKRASVLYQIIDNKVALISIQDPNIPFYTDINAGNSVIEVMKAHNDKLTYEVDKYAIDGDYYSLIANVNFRVIKEPALGELLEDEHIELNNKEDTLPLQIEYHLKGGQKIADDRIEASEWSEENKGLLKGQVESIDIGIPEAIYLVEGCS